MVVEAVTTEVAASDWPGAWLVAADAYGGERTCPGAGRSGSRVLLIFRRGGVSIDAGS